MPLPAKISIDNAKKDKLFYFVANALVYRKSDGRCLILKRDPREKVHPGRFATPGGKLEWGDFDLSKPVRIIGDVLNYDGAVEKMLKREIKEEAGIEVADDFQYIKSIAFVRPDETPVVLIKFAVEYKGGEVKLEEGSFTDFAWVNAAEIKEYDCLEGTDEEVEKAASLFG
jgi:8-oxo-dGTP pyrophosphatase MutT (NUDIX family)